jgi:hypothetical protein
MNSTSHEIKMSTSLDEGYYKKALDSYKVKDYKVCLIFVNQIDVVNNIKYANLLLNCTYDYWKDSFLHPKKKKRYQHLDNYEDALYINDLNNCHDNSVEDEEVEDVTSIIDQENNTKLLQLFQDNYTKVLTNNNLPLLPYDYIRISYLYLSQGNLNGGLKILTLASVRGYLEEPLIIIQSWSIMRRISDEEETMKTIEYLSSTLILESNKRLRKDVSNIITSDNNTNNNNSSSSNIIGGSYNTVMKHSKSLNTISNNSSNNNSSGNNVNIHNNYNISKNNSIIPIVSPTIYPSSLQYVSDSLLPLYYLYLHCTCFLYKQSITYKNNKVKYHNYLHNFYIILSEAYYIAYSKINENFNSLFNWFNDVNLWLSMGVYLDDDTPFILLAQHSYWEAFIRNPKDDIALK